MGNGKILLILPSTQIHVKHHNQAHVRTMEDVYTHGKGSVASRSGKKEVHSQRGKKQRCQINGPVSTTKFLHPSRILKPNKLNMALRQNGGARGGLHAGMRRERCRQARRIHWKSKGDTKKTKSRKKWEKK